MASTKPFKMRDRKLAQAWLERDGRLKAFLENACVRDLRREVESFAGARRCRRAAQGLLANGHWPPTCNDKPVEYRTKPKTSRQWVRYIVVATIALGLVSWMLRLYVL
jgi:hypothetical protein